MDDDKFTLNRKPDGCELSGELALANPAAFENLFSSVRKDLESADGDYTIDVARVVFMNSSGISSLARLVMSAAKKKIKLIFVVDEAFLWQRKVLSALAQLSDAVEIRPSDAAAPESGPTKD